MAFGTPKRIEIKYNKETIQNMLALIRDAPLPNNAPVDTSEPWKLGIEIEYLKKLKAMFLSEWSWDVLEKKIAKFENYLVHYEHEGNALDLHYVHVRSQRSDAIPLILLHGWPGTFFEFHKVIEPLINPASPELPAFHIIIPSIPGFFLSTLPGRHGWSLVDTATVYHGLMTSVLRYGNYAGHGGDWGRTLLRIMGCLFPESVLVMHFTSVATRLVSDPSEYTEFEKKAALRADQFRKLGIGYMQIQATKPFTIGLAVGSSPFAVLTYIGEKLYDWSDPERIDPHDILDTVALYYLSGSFHTSVTIYTQISVSSTYFTDPNQESKWFLKNKFGLSAFPYELAVTPKRDLERIGPLVYYKEHANGGHFPALDSPVELVEDLREFFGEYWPRI